MSKLNIEAPWYEYQKKVKALFERDADFVVGEVYRPEGGAVDYAFDIEIYDHNKYLAMDRVLPSIREFGNVTLGICLFDRENNEGADTDIELYRTIFNGNPIVKDIRTVVDRTGSTHGYVRFMPEVIQFFHDDLSDFNGNWSGLAQDIAREIFEGENFGVHFCTAGVNETAENLEMPLGEWP